MEKIDSFIEKLYGNGQMLQFYLILGAIALFFAVLIIITLVQTKSSSKKLAKETLEEKNEELAEPVKIVPDTKSEEEFKKASAIFMEDVEEEEKLTDTQIFNNVLLNDEEENYASKLTPSPVENPVIIKEEPSKEESSIEDNFFIEKEEIKEEPVSTIEIPNEDKTISELFNEPVLENYESKEQIDETFEENIPSLESAEIEEVSSLSEPEVDNGPVILSNAEIERRLAKLKSSHKEPTEEDQGLTELMKTVGLEDTIIIPEIKDEERKLSR